MSTYNILGVCTSPRRKKNTETLVHEVLRGSESKGAKTELFTVSQKKMNPCKGCLSCEKGLACPQNDDITELLAAMQKADGIIMASPVYFYDVTSQCKMILDRSYAVHPLNQNKVGGIVTVAGSLGCQQVIHTLNMFFSVHGITSAGFVSAFGGAAEDEAAKLSAFRLGVKMVDMLNIQSSAPKGAYDMHDHHAYGVVPRKT